jgi:hypothetical protein
MPDRQPKFSWQFVKGNTRVNRNAADEAGLQDVACEKWQQAGRGQTGGLDVSRWRRGEPFEPNLAVVGELGGEPVMRPGAGETGRQIRPSSWPRVWAIHRCQSEFVPVAVNRAVFLSTIGPGATRMIRPFALAAYGNNRNRKAVRTFHGPPRFVIFAWTVTAAQLAPPKFMATVKPFARPPPQARVGQGDLRAAVRRDVVRGGKGDRERSAFELPAREQAGDRLAEGTNLYDDAVYAKGKENLRG